MYRKKKKTIICVLLAAMLFLTTVNVYAAENESDVLVNGMLVSYTDLDDYCEGFIEISPPQSRIDSDGDFTFDVQFTLQSTSFYVSSDTITIQVRARIEYGAGEDVTDRYPNHRFQIEFGGGGIFGESASRTFYADGTTYYWTISGLDTDTLYAFTIINNDELPNGTSVVGTGRISNYVHP